MNNKKKMNETKIEAIQQGTLKVAKLPTYWGHSKNVTEPNHPKQNLTFVPVSLEHYNVELVRERKHQTQATPK